MRSISIRRMLLLVAMVAFVVIVLVRPSLFWCQAALSAALVFCGWSLVLAIARDGAARRFGIAAAIFACGYLWLSLHTEATQNSSGTYMLGRSLITHRALESLAALLGHQFPFGYQDFELWDGQMFSTATTVAVGPNGQPVTGFGGGGFGGGAGAPGVTFRAVPGTGPNGRYQHYLIGGHSLLAMLFGWLAGTLAARWLKPRETAAASPPAAA